MASTGEKRKVTASRSTNEYVLYVIDFVLRTVLTFNLAKKLCTYFIVVTCLSVFSDIQRPGSSYFSNKHNILNQYFVKLGWGWTMAGVIALLVIVNLIQHKGEIKNIQYAIIRLTVLTLHWYICTHSFQWLENYTGTCSKSSIASKRPCIRDGYNWLGFDISGHCFLLTFSLTIINEESQVLHWISKKLDNIERDRDERLKNHVVMSSSSFRVLLRFSMLLLVFLTFLWEFMLVITSLYFHTTAQKVLGMFVAVLGWFITYRVLKLNHDVQGM